MTRRINAAAVVAVVIVGALLAGCGSSSGSSGTPTTASTIDISEPGGASTLPLYVPPDATGSSVAPTLTLPPPVSVVEDSALPVDVESADGQTVTITDASRVVPLWGSLAEVTFELGLGDRVVARDISATFVEAEGLPVVTRGHDVSAESVLSLRPTLVLAQSDSGPAEALEQIRNAGVPVLVLDVPTTVDAAIARIRTIATALGMPVAGEALAQRTLDAVDSALAAVPTTGTPPTVAFLYVRGGAGVYLIGGPGSGADSMIVAAGGVDAGTAMGLDQAFTPLTSEALVVAAPDAIIVTTTGLESVGGIDGLVALPGLAQTPAGLNRRVIAIEDGLLYSFGARMPEAITEIIRQLYAPA